MRIIFVNKFVIVRLSSYESPSNMERQLSFLSIADDTDGLDKILKVKIHPERKFMDEDKENQPGGVNIFKLLSLLLND